MKRKLLIVAAVCLALLACLAFSFTASAEESKPAVSIEKFNLAFEDNTYIKYAVKFTGIEDAKITTDNIGMLYWKDTADGFVPGTEDFSSATTGYTEISGEKYYVFKYTNMVAKQLADYVYSVAYLEYEGETYYSEPVKFSALEYCYSKLGKTGVASTNADFRNLLTATLEQGAAAQKYFKYNADRLANAEYYQINLVGGTFEDGFSSGLFLATDKVTITAPETSGDLVFAGWQNSAGEIAFTTNVATVENLSKNETYTAQMVCSHSNIILVPGTSATCTTPGLTDGEQCTKCGEIIVEQTVIDALGHTEVIDAAVAPTCTETGLTEGKHCSVCNEVLVAQTTVNALGHTEVIDDAVEPTCTLTGLTEGKHCSVCNEVLAAQTVVAALGHTEVIDAAVAPTCTETGLTEGKHCTKCGEIFVAQEAIPATGHSFGDWVIVKEATTTAEGLKERTCKCGEKETEIIPAKVSEGLKFTSNGGGTCKVSGIGTCTDTDIVIPSTSPAGDSVTSIGDSAFRSCTSITSITIPDSVTSIGGSAFSSCTSLTSINIPDSVTSIGEWAFCNCRSLDSVTIGDSVTSIGNYAFDDCTSLESIIIGDSVTSIGNYAFQYCSSLESIIIGDSVTSIGSCAFNGCTSLTSITIPDSMTSIGGSAFTGCTSLTSINIPDSVTSIGGGAFSHCKSLTSITIPDSVTSIGYGAFYGCSNLTDIYYTGNEVDWSKITIGSSNDNLTQAARYYYSEKQPTDEGNFWHYVDGNITIWEIHKHAYSAVVTQPTCTSDGFTTYTCTCGDRYIADTIAALGHTEVIDAAVAPTCTATGLTEGKHCSVCNEVLAAQSVVAALGHTEVIDDAVAPTCTDIGFDNCTVCLTCGDIISCGSFVPALGHKYSNNSCTVCGHSITPSTGLEFSLLSNGTYAVTGIGTCTDKYIVIPANYNGRNVTLIGGSAFEGKSRSGIYIPSTVSSIGAYAFQRSSFDFVYMEEGVKSVGASAFAANYGSVNVMVIPSTLETIGKEAFMCGSLCVIISSATVAQNAQTYDSVGYLLFHSQSVMLREGLSRGGYISSGRSYQSDVEFMGDKYTLFNKHDPIYHNYSEYTAFGWKGQYCSSCYCLIDLK